ncbi:hypothetical protein L3Q82_015634 [Scortum barcoo]|uniref:Uncharacterized protein n=1 Tax=Scortum barcoo TaxID=214431 RepID=A0ACB8VP34_9TELE|nr:hypothetical protein L3Q82_015634 [Scortum barcoo]
MGSGESTTRKVSFGVDDEDRVRILRGVKLSEDVLQRMRGVANIAPERTSSPASSPQKDTGASRSTNSSSRPQQSPQHRPQPSTQSSTGKSGSYAKEEQRRYERQQTILKEELSKLAQRERESAREEVTKAMSRERLHTRQEAEKAKQLVQAYTVKCITGNGNESPITLSFLPWRQYYQCSASGKLHPESFLELEIGMVQGWRFSRGKGRACFTHQPAPVSLRKQHYTVFNSLLCVCALLQAQQLHKKDAQLKALDAFYKEQLAQLEERILYARIIKAQIIKKHKNRSCHSEVTMNSANKYYLELLHLVEEYDSDLSTHFTSSAVFSGISLNIRNDLISAIASIRTEANLERYKQSKEQFHQAASKTEANLRSRNTDPVCPGLQAQILSCYRESRDQTLRCSDLAKEYMQCINAAKKVRAFVRS